MIKLTTKEQENLERVLQTYPAYMKPVIKHFFKSYSLDEEGKITSPQTENVGKENGREEERRNCSTITRA